ncbi:hypothetical protein [Gulosibacter faecalis]|uniref:Peptidoglycan binding-like domain-containing protein n=1 Tax=Gulosibacter faecalis TaxID=272240 RepID=A0ABW5UVX8_9MICO|nr:hypothetical protein [Gulosibacter faecalis]
MAYGYVVEDSALYGELATGGYRWAEPDFATRRSIQAALKKVGRYPKSSPVDGIWGPNTIKGIQTTIKPPRAGYTGPVDGAVGRNTVKYVHEYAYNWKYNVTIGRFIRPLPNNILSNNRAPYAGMKGSHATPLVWAHFLGRLSA